MLEREVAATCGSCKDMFSITLVDRRGEVSLEPSQTVGFVAGDLVHRPGRCGGAISLLGPEKELRLVGLRSLVDRSPETFERAWARG